MKTKQWQFLGDSKVLYGESGFTWIGTIAHEIRNMANKALREQGISIDSHGVDFFDKCLFQYLDASVKAVNDVYSEELALATSKAI
jgi:hypothetical protein